MSAVNNDFKQSLFCHHFLDFLIVKGFDYFVFSPGARNSPLVLSLLQKKTEKKIKVFSHFDERGAAFFALGLNKGNPDPSHPSRVAVITTSGSAVANLLPSLVEANYGGFPMLVITADRPNELHDLGANQTIGHHILESQLAYYLPLDPWFLFTQTKNWNSISGRLNEALSYLSIGSVQINLSLREPFDEMESKTEKLKSTSSNPLLSGWQYNPIQSEISNTIIDEISNQLKSSKKGMVIVGELPQNIDKTEIKDCLIKFSEQGWLIVCDGLSGLSVDNIPWLHYETWLTIPEIRKKTFHQVDTILHLGGRLVAKHFYGWLQESRNNESKRKLNYIHINSNLKRYDPAEVITTHYPIEALGFCQQFIKLEDGRIPRQVGWEKMKSYNKKFLTYQNDFQFSEITEPYVMKEIQKYFQSRLEKEKSVEVFLGNSRPIRDFFEGFRLSPSSPNAINDLKIYASRGASGIDGQIATAIGIGTGDGVKGVDRFYAIFGDLTFLYDLNSLALLSQLADRYFTFIVINNGEGTIFNFLPLLKNRSTPLSEDHLDQFLYRHSFRFQPLAEMFDLDYQLINQANQIVNVLENSPQGRNQIIEVKIDSQTNFNAHQNYQIELKNYLKQL